MQQGITAFTEPKAHGIVQAFISPLPCKKLKLFSSKSKPFFKGRWSNE